MWDNLLKRLEGIRWEYDGFGRMTERHDSQRGIVQHFSYDDEHRIREVLIEGDAEYTRAQYQYDALGRRIGKQVWRRNAVQPECTHYAWSGMQMVGEYSDSKPEAAVQYVYAENSYEPLARVDSYQQHAEVYWYHTEINGLPDRVTDNRGDTVWQGAFAAWGRITRERTGVDWDVPQNLRFQGQYLDRETGLHYNTFRYYDPCGGRYTQLDPIGLAGGLNLYGYVPDPLTWSDPLGLVGCVGSRPTEHLPPHVEGEYLYRGIYRGHPDEANALRGRVEPGNHLSNISEDEHNLGEVSSNSPFTSWTRDPDVARKFAKEDGVILRVKTGAPPEGAGWSWAWSPDRYYEQEVLLRGARSGDIEVFLP